jgi:hypothetical protein
MLLRSIRFVVGALASTFTCAQTPQLAVVPAAYAATDAISHLWVPGANADVRQQTLIGPMQLTGMVGRALTALELRRSAADDV